MRLLNVTLFVAGFLFISYASGPLHAYLDPGTGSMLIQLALGGIVGGLAIVKLYWRRLKTLLGRRDAADPSSGD